MCGDSNGAVTQCHRHFGRLNFKSVLALKSTQGPPDSLKLLQSGAVGICSVITLQETEHERQTEVTSSDEYEGHLPFQ